MVKTLALSLLLTSAVALHAETIPALSVGDASPVALRDIVSLKFSEGQLRLLQTNGSLIITDLQPITFTTVEAGSAITAIRTDAPSTVSVYTPAGQFMGQTSADAAQQLFSQFPAGPYIVRQGDSSYKVQLDGSNLQPSTLTLSSPFNGDREGLSPLSTPSVAAADAATEQALQLDAAGISPQCPLTSIDSLYFNADQSLLVVERQSLCEGFQLSTLTGISFPTLESVVTIRYQDDTVTGINPYHFQGLTVSADGAGVMVNNLTVLDTEVEYQLSGSSQNGYFRINSDYKWKATLIGLTLTNPSGSVLLSFTGKKGTVKSQNGYTNTLSDGASYQTLSGVDQKAAIFSEGQLIFSGKGTLNVTSLAKHGIASDDYVSFENGTVNVLGAVGDAIHANDSVLVQSGTVTLASSSDGIDCEGPITIRRGDKGAPSLTVTTTANGAKGIKTGADFLMTDGTVTINQTGGPDTSGEDKSNVVSIRATGNITITGGTVNINNTAKGGKGLSAGGTVTIGDNATVNSNL